MLLKPPGALFWGGTRTDPITGERVSGWQYGQCLPDDAANMFEEEIGWDGYQFIHLKMSYDMRGIDRAVDLAERIVNGGGMVQIGCFGTPLELASIDSTYKENDGQLLYRKKPPSDYKAWGHLYARIIMRFLRRIPADKIFFNLWMEPHRYAWRQTDEEFFLFYDAVQTVVKEMMEKARRLNDPKFANFLNVQFGGIQLSDIRDSQIDDGNEFITTPALEWMRKFFVEAKQNDWQVDFWDCFQYGQEPDMIVDLILGVQTLMEELHLEIPLMFNCVSSAGYFAEREPNGEELDARYRAELIRKIHTKTDVWYANCDAVEDFADFENSRYMPCGLLESGTLRKRPSWGIVKMITEKALSFGSDDGNVEFRIE